LCSSSHQLASLQLPGWVVMGHMHNRLLA
jgi:hypothetical protein